MESFIGNQGFLEKNFLCKICYQEMNINIKYPVLYQCGHTVCINCFNMRKNKCPFCNEYQHNTQIRKNFDLINLVENFMQHKSENNGLKTSNNNIFPLKTSNHNAIFNSNNINKISSQTSYLNANYRNPSDNFDYSNYSQVTQNNNHLNLYNLNGNSNGTNKINNFKNNINSNPPPISNNFYSFNQIQMTTPQEYNKNMIFQDYRNYDFNIEESDHDSSFESYKSESCHNLEYENINKISNYEFCQFLNKRIDRMTKQELNSLKATVRDMKVPDLQDLFRSNGIPFSGLVKDSLRNKIHRYINGFIKKRATKSSNYKNEDQLKDKIKKMRKRYYSYTNDRLKCMLNSKNVPCSQMNKQELVNKLISIYKKK